MKNAIDKFGSQQITDPIFLAGELMFKALSGVGAVTFNPLVFIIGEVGSLLNKKLSNNIEKKRILILFESFKNEIGKIKDELNKNSDYLNSEEFYDLIILSIEKVIRERHKEKIKIYSKLLKGAITSNNIKDFEYRTLTYEEYINIVSQLNIIDIEIIRYAFNSKGKSIQFNLLKHRKLLKNVSLDEDDIRYSLTKLEKLGLFIDEKNYTQYGTKMWLNGIIQPYFMKTKCFYKVVDYIMSDKSD